MGVHIIAEAGSNYNGSLELAFELNAVAADSGADSVKYQIIYPEGLYRPGKYDYGHYDSEEVWKIRESGVMDESEWHLIAKNAISSGIPFSASVFDTRGLSILRDLDPPYLKIASCDLNNYRFLAEVAQAGLKMVVSTGMSTLQEIEEAVRVILQEGLTSEQLVLLHCVSVYPAQLEDTNLAFISTLKKEFGTDVGFSDHTKTNEAACLAVALGAKWIEKHFTTDNTLEGFDHEHAQTPSQLKEYIAVIRATENSLTGNGQNKISEPEAYTQNRARRGLYAAKALPKGHQITAEDIAVVRPTSPLPASSANLVVGKTLVRDLAAFEPFSELDFADSSDL